MSTSSDEPRRVAGEHCRDLEALASWSQVVSPQHAFGMRELTRVGLATSAAVAMGSSKTRYTITDDGRKVLKSLT